jgi:hypothetical protein
MTSRHRRYEALKRYGSLSFKFWEIQVGAKYPSQKRLNSTSKGNLQISSELDAIQVIQPVSKKGKSIHMCTEHNLGRTNENIFRNLLKEVHRYGSGAYKTTGNCSMLAVGVGTNSIKLHRKNLRISEGWRMSVSQMKANVPQDNSPTSLRADIELTCGPGANGSCSPVGRVADTSRP